VARLGRIRQAAEYQRVIEHGKIAPAQGHILVRFLSSDKGVPRLGIIVGRKALKRAVDRNRAKRMCREAFRQKSRALPPVDIVVQIRVRAEPLHWRTFWRDLNTRLDAVIHAPTVWR
jgi:ribonuclease P protein component